jgi:hypothetical protein
MADLPNIQQATPDQILADYIAADRARQLDEAVYTQAITDPETSQRYREDLGFRMEIDLHRQGLMATDRALADEGISPEQRNRILQALINGREPYRGVDLVFGAAEPINLPHGPFSIAAEQWVTDGPRHFEVIVRCACGWAQKWDHSVSAGQLLAWLRDHPAQKEQHEAARRPAGG